MSGSDVLDIRGHQQLRTIGGIADKEDVRVYVVGGMVRDLIMGKNSSDIDIVVDGDGVAFAKKLSRELGGGFVVWEKFGTSELQLDWGKLEVATARTEEYALESRKPRVERAGIEADLSRRDFTVNCIAASLNAGDFGAIIDPYGGRNDIEAKLLRTPLDPSVTFSDDPLRMMRAARFAAQLEFEVDSESIRAIRETRERISIVSQERVTGELLRILAARKPSVGFVNLAGTGLLEIILPEIFELIGVEQVGKYHHKDVFWHTLEVVDNVAVCSDNVDLRFAALLHDIAKPATKRFNDEKGWTFHGHEVVGVRIINELGRRLKLPRRTIDFAAKMTALHLRPIALAMEGVTDSAIRRLIVLAGEEIDDLLTLCRADITTKNPEKVKRYLRNFDIVEERVAEVIESDELKAFQSPVRGDEIMEICGLKPGPAVGGVKSAIENAILDGEIPNEHEAALKFLLTNKKKLLEIWN